MYRRKLQIYAISKRFSNLWYRDNCEVMHEFTGPPPPPQATLHTIADPCQAARWQQEPKQLYNSLYTYSKPVQAQNNSWNVSPVAATFSETCVLNLIGLPEVCVDITTFWIIPENSTTTRREGRDPQLDQHGICNSGRPTQSDTSARVLEGAGGWQPLIE
jgi:hypothetical protein